MFGYVIEKSGVTWTERFWVDIPAFGIREFGSDDRARVFPSEVMAEAAITEIEDEFGCHCYIVKRSDLYPPAMQ